jgi:25S rRNA (cytosine2278-C5)-methyltransferase
MGTSKGTKALQKGSSNSSPYSRAGQLLNQIWHKEPESQKNKGHPRNHHPSSSGSLGGLKAVAYTNNGEMNCSKTTYAQCANVLKHKRLLDEIVEVYNEKQQTNNKKKLLSESSIKNQGLFHVLLYELLLGPNHAIRGGGALKRTLMDCHKDLEAIAKQLAKHHIPTGLLSANNHGSDPIVTTPRYVRINTVQSSLITVVQGLQKKLEQQQEQQQQQEPNNQQQVSFFLDRHVPNLLVLPPTPESRAMLQDYVQSHQVVLQDKSSCFSALCLVHGFDKTANDEEIENGDYLDACAAPGNKTSHLAALLAEQAQKRQQHRPASSHDNNVNKKKRKKQGTKTEVEMMEKDRVVVVHALDRSPERFESLQRRMTELVNTATTITTTAIASAQDQDRKEIPQYVRVECHKRDFLTTSQADFPTVTCLLLDPSCSGSGMAHHRNSSSSASIIIQDDSSSVPMSNYEPPTPHDVQRVQSLASFQLLALKHAMTKFDKVTKIVYSTCSLYQQENELVVLHALREAHEELQEKGTDTTWELVAPRCLKHWHRRGVTVEGQVTAQEAETMIRVDPSAGDETNGFFVACLQRRRPPPSTKLPSTGTQTNVDEAETDSHSDNLGEGVNLKVYNGEFRQQTSWSTHDDEEMEMNDATTLQDSTKSSGQQKMTEGSRSKGTEKTQHKHDDFLAKKGDANAVTATTLKAVDPNKLGKKRAKKLAWKGKQRDNKRRRLEQK